MCFVPDQRLSAKGQVLVSVKEISGGRLEFILRQKAGTVAARGSRDGARGSPRPELGHGPRQLRCLPRRACCAPVLPPFVLRGLKRPQNPAGQWQPGSPAEGSPLLHVQKISSNLKDTLQCFECYVLYCYISRVFIIFSS